MWGNLHTTFLREEVVVILFPYLTKFTKTKGFEKRAQHYTAKAYSSQADQGDDYHNLKEIIFIAVADCIIFPDLDQNSFEHDLKDFYFVFIELPKFTKTKEDQLENIVEKWCYFFKHAGEISEDDLRKIIGSDLIIGRTYDKLNQYNWSKEERLAYDQAKKRTDDYLSSFEKKLHEGIQIGHQKGRIESKIEVAKNSLKIDVSIDVIAEITGLSLDEIKKLRD